MSTRRGHPNPAERTAPPTRQVAPDLDARIEALLDRELDDADRSALFNDLLASPQRAQELTETQQTINALRSAEPGPDLTERILGETHRRRPFLPGAVRKQITVARLGIAAVLLLAVGGFAVASNHHLVPIFRPTPAPMSNLIAQSETELADSVRSIGRAIGTVRSLAVDPDAVNPTASDPTASDPIGGQFASEAGGRDQGSQHDHWQLAISVPPIEPPAHEVGRLPSDLASFRTPATRANPIESSAIIAPPTAVDREPTTVVVADVLSGAVAGAVAEPSLDSPPFRTTVIVGLESRRPTLLNPAEILCTSRVTQTPLEINDRDPRHALPVEQSWHMLFKHANGTLVPVPLDQLLLHESTDDQLPRTGPIPTPTEGP